MITKKALSNMDSTDIGWIKSIHHYSFGDFNSSKFKNFGVLEALDDNTILPRSGFHNNPQYHSEIMSYVIEGELTYGDSLGNDQILPKDNVQYINAGSGITFEAHNFSSSPLRLLQICINSKNPNSNPSSKSYSFDMESKENHWVYLASSINGLAPIKIHQDINIYSSKVHAPNNIEFSIRSNRKGYLIQVYGKAIVTCYNGSDNHKVLLEEKDALEIFEDEIKIACIEDSHFILFEMNML